MICGIRPVRSYRRDHKKGRVVEVKGNMALLGSNKVFDGFLKDAVSFWDANAMTVIAMLVFAVAAAAGPAAAAAGDEFFKGSLSDLVGKAEITIKMVRFIAIFIVIGGLIWAGVEFAVKDNQQKGATVLISAVVGGFFVLIAPTAMTFIIGGLFKEDTITVT